ncbi:MAG TPA: hypothetical protein VG757_04090 [Devosia sp.]|nr:hypothetical protein [Devosia sp.]
MKTIAALAFASALALSTGAAIAADAPSDDFMGDGVVTDDSGFDWDGFFITVYGAYAFGFIDPATGEGISLGVNMTSDNILYGVTVTAGTFQGGQLDGQFISQGVVRLGVLATDNVVLYGLAGLGWETYHDAYYIPTGLGVEFGVTDNISLRLQYQANYVPPENDWASSLSAGLSWYF